MKRMRFVFLLKKAYCLSLGIAAIFVSQAFAWTQPEFAIATYYDPCLSANTDTGNITEVNAAVSRFQTAKNAYFNLLTGTQNWHSWGNPPVVKEFDPTECQDTAFPYNIVHDEKGMNYALYIAKKAGLKYMVTDFGFWYCGLPFMVDTAYRVLNNYLNLEPGRRNALYGYDIIDEPDGDDGGNGGIAKSWIQFFGRYDNSRLSFVNLYPVYAFASKSDYVNYINYWTTGTKPDVLCFDHYPFYSDGHWANYFYNLQLCQTKALTAGQNLWCAVESVKQDGRPDPDTSRIRFMVFCPVAYGVRGLVYFAYEKPHPCYPAQFGDAIINQCTQQTSRYNRVKTINRYLKNIVGPITMNCTSKGAYHKSTLPWGYEDAIVKMLPASEAPIVSTVSNDNCLVGTFQSNSTPTTYYVIVVNKSLSRITNITVSLKHNYSGKITKAPSVINYNGSTTWTSVSGTTSFSIYDLYGGEGQFYKFTNITNPY